MLRFLLFFCSFTVGLHDIGALGRQRRGPAASGAEHPQQWCHPEVGRDVQDPFGVQRQRDGRGASRDPPTRRGTTEAERHQIDYQTK